MGKRRRIYRKKVNDERDGGDVDIWGGGRRGVLSR